LWHLVIVILLALLLLVLVPLHEAAGAVLDPHWIYEQKCSRCHDPHGALFAARHLAGDGGRVVGKRSGRELSAILDDHRGASLSEDQVEALVAHFTAMLETGFLFQSKCTVCHGRAVALARTFLIIRDDRLLGRYSGRDIEVFLQGHGRLDAGEIPVIVAMLKRQLASQTP
jgi:hypothetical protein